MRFSERQDMRAILKVLMKVTTIVIFLGYLPLLGISYLVEPVKNVDVCYLQVGNDQTPLGVYGHKLASSKKPKIIVLGASGVMHGFRTEELELDFPGHQIANLAVSGTNISGIQQVAEAVQKTIPRDVLDKSIYVSGVFFGTFIENRIRYGRFRKDKKNQPDCHLQLLEHGYYRKDGNSVLPKYSPEVWATLETLERPLRVFSNKLKFDYQKPFRNLEKIVKRLNRYKKNKNKKPDQNFAKNMELNKMVNFWLSFMDRPEGDLADEQFEELIKLAEYVEEHKIHMVIVDLPIPVWHQKMSPLSKDFQFKKRKYLKRVRASKYLHYFDMQHLNNAKYFVDSVHVSKSNSYRWSRELKKFLTSINNKRLSSSGFFY